MEAWYKASLAEVSSQRPLLSPDAAVARMQGHLDALAGRPIGHQVRVTMKGHDEAKRTTYIHFVDALTGLTIGRWGDVAALVLPRPVAAEQPSIAASAAH